MTVGRHHHVILDPDADAAEAGVDVLVARGNVEAGFDREDHPGFEGAVLAVDPVRPDVVHV